MSQIKNKFLSGMPADTLKGNNTGSTANPTDLTVAQVNTMLGDLLVANNLSDVSSASISYNNISPMTTTGDIEYEVSTGTASRLPIGTTGQVLTVVSGLPTWTTATSSLTGLGIMSGRTTLSSATTSEAVTFSTAFVSATGYSIVGNLVNLTDPNPQFQPLTITAQSTTGATFSWNEPLSSSNYLLCWHAILIN